jgi:hypothetical protein
MVNLKQAEKNVSETNVYKLLRSLHDGEDYERELQEDCSNLIRKEEERIKKGGKICKSGVKKHIKYLKNQVNIHYQREVLYHALQQAIQNGDYVGEI